MRIYISRHPNYKTDKSHSSQLLKNHKTKQRIFGIIFIIVLIICLMCSFYPTSSSSYLAGNEPEWVENIINTSANITNVESGPSYWSNVDHLLAFDIQFYNAKTNQQIKDYNILEELLGMFQSTDEPFVYDRNRSNDGNCFVYYNGIVPAEYKPAIFSGFKGKSNFPECSFEKIDSVYMVIYHTYSSESKHNLDIQSQLDEIQKSSSQIPY